MSDIILNIMLVVDEVGALFVYSVVREVHHDVLNVLLARFFVLLRGEPAEALLVDEDLEGPDTFEEDVDSHVEFEIVYEVGVHEVFLDYVVFAVVESLFDLLGEEDSFTL